MVDKQAMEQHAMDLSARGKKRQCLECEEPFYDLNRDPAPCPSCGHSHPLEIFVAGKRPPPEAEPKAKAKDAEDKTDDDDEDDIIGDDDDDDAVLPGDDDDDLDDDDDDIVKVAVVSDDNDD